MWIVVIAWIYVAVMMAVAEAFGPQGSILGGIITLLLYGVAPLALVIYLMNTPMRRRRLREQEAAERQGAAAPSAAAPLQPDAGGLPPGDPIAPEGKEP
ncbi:hypothetical protein EIP75_11900 [Aquabacterium soli]|jgi:membrane protein implicated in regulation of membrane protease activity|uniref:Uncharacterized protein n=1 Tax=Aquabacterium soli TaxID=2493092 RepID=A0A426VB87_9BURK|nr:hypothetical protein [Aquabacterium soli]RRS04081.1 hypothetical protein EIP75_11900 [Aquabacterium soli]